MPLGQLYLEVQETHNLYKSVLTARRPLAKSNLRKLGKRDQGSSIEIPRLPQTLRSRFGNDKELNQPHALRVAYPGKLKGVDALVESEQQSRVF